MTIDIVGRICMRIMEPHVEFKVCINADASAALRLNRLFSGKLRTDYDIVIQPWVPEQEVQNPNLSIKQKSKEIVLFVPVDPQLLTLGESSIYEEYIFQAARDAILYFKEKCLVEYMKKPRARKNTAKSKSSTEPRSQARKSTL